MLNVTFDGFKMGPWLKFFRNAIKTVLKIHQLTVNVSEQLFLLLMFTVKMLKQWMKYRAARNLDVSLMHSLFFVKVSALH